jgi:ribosomal protein L16 Arg81 hydroxylase
VDGVLANSEEQHETFSHVRTKPHVLDDEIVNRAINLYQAQLDDLWFYEEQFARWLKEPLTAGQREEVNRLAGQLPPGAPRARELSEKILALLHEIKRGTINRILEKDAPRGLPELGLEFLLKNRKR